jgi:predicted MFS family arabinose efflux permease
VIPLWRSREFLKLWIGQTISEIGSRITREGLPLTAVIVLGATSAQMGILSATGGASVLLFSLWAGVIVDRVRRRPVMIGADLGRALLLTSVPVLALLHTLSMVHLIAVAACTGVLTVLFDVAYQSYLPSLVGPEELFEGNRLLSISGSTAEILGPSLTGVLVQLITAPIAILLDALSFLVSGVSVWLIGKPEPAAHAVTHESLREEALGGMKTILAHPLLRALLFRSITAFLAMGLALNSFYVLYAIRVLGFKPASLGIAIALGGAGGLIGGLVSNRIARLVPLKFSFFGSALMIACFQSLVPLASVVPRFSLLLICLQQFFGDFAWTIYYVNETTLRQSVAPAHLLGRVNAAIQLASRGMLPIGALAGGFLAGKIGIVNTLWIGAAGVLLSTLWLLPVTRSSSTSAGRI